MKTLNPVIHNKQRERIFKIAMHLFAVKGYGETSMSAIAQACKMQKASLYHYFKSKEQVLHELVRWRIKVIHSQINAFPIAKGPFEMLNQIGMSFLNDMEKKESQEFMQLMLRNAYTDPFMRKIFLTISKEQTHDMDFNHCHGRLLHNKVGKKSQFMFLHQFIGSLIRYATEKKMWKTGPSLEFSDKEYVHSLATIFAEGMKKLYKTGKKAMPLLFLGLSFLFAPVWTGAQAVLNVDDYLSQVQDNNPALQASSQTQKGYTLKAKEVDMEFSPLFNANYTAVDDKKQPTSLLSPSETQAYSWNLGLSKKWFTGTTISLNYGLNYTNLMFPSLTGIPGFPPSLLDSLVPSIPYYDVAPSLTVSQSLLRDFMCGLTGSTVSKTKAQANAAEKAEHLRAETLKSQAEMAYWQLSLARAVVAYDQESLSRTAKLLEWSQRRVNLNLADRSDLYQTQAAYKLKELNLKMAQQDLLTQQRNFNTFRGRSGDEVPENLEDLNHRLSDPSFQNAEIKKQNDRLDVQASGLMMQSARYEVTETFYKSLPDLNAFGTVVYNGHDYGALAAYDTSLSGGQPTYTVGLTFIAPLDFFTLNQIQQGYDSDYAAAQRNLDSAKLNESQDWRNLLKSWEDVNTRLSLAKEIQDLQEEKLKNETERFNNGRTTTFQLLSFEDDFDQAQLNTLRLGVEKLSILAQAKLYNAN